MRLLAIPLLVVTAFGATVRFDPSSPEIGPFPTDFLTVPDPGQQTGLRISLPSPDCSIQRSACQDLDLLNQLDGFNLQPRIRVRFSAAIRPETLRDGIFFVWRDTGRFTPINQVIYDPSSLSAYAKADEILDQRHSYILVVTNAVLGAAGDPVDADGAFSQCLASPAPNDYCARLAALLNSVAPLLAPRRIVAASVFTTLSATAWMEKARAALQGSPLNLQIPSFRGVFDVANLSSLVWSQQVRVNPPEFRDSSLPLSLLDGVGRLGLGSFRSPNFLNDRQIIPPASSGAAVSLPSGDSEIPFHAWLPASPMPAGGYPVVIMGHGLGDSRFGAPSALASTFARRGLATVAISAVGHGFGPDSKLVLTLRSEGGAISLPAGGRAVDLNGDGVFDSSEGCVLIPGPIGIRDCLRQTALDLMQLVRAIRAGVDFDRDGRADLDPTRIYYAGQSLGSFYGTIFAAVEPNVAAVALNVGGGSVIETARWSPAFRPLVLANLAFHSPSLLNRGVANFDENYVLRDRPVKVNDVPGAPEIQNYLETVEWMDAIGDPLAYAPHLRRWSLPAVPAKPVLWQFAVGDQTVPNPATSLLIRAGNGRGSPWFSRSREFQDMAVHGTWYYRHDLARQLMPDLGSNPHAFLTNVLVTPGALAIALAAQEQMAVFFLSNGTHIPDVNAGVTPLFGRNLFEAPAALPEDLNF